MLHVFISIRDDDEFLDRRPGGSRGYGSAGAGANAGRPSACLGGVLVPNVERGGMEISRAFDGSGVLNALESPLVAVGVDLRPGDVITAVDGARLNASLPRVPIAVALDRAMIGKAGAQVLLEIDAAARDDDDDDDDDIYAAMAGGGGGLMDGGLMNMFGGGGGAGGGGGGAGGMPIVIMPGGGGGGGGGGGDPGHPSGLPTASQRSRARRTREMFADAAAALGGDSPRRRKKNHSKLRGGAVGAVVATPFDHQNCSDLRAADAVRARRCVLVTLVPIRSRSRGERRSLRTLLPGVSLRPPLGFNPRPRCLSTPTDAFQLHPGAQSLRQIARRRRRRVRLPRRHGTRRRRRQRVFRRLRLAVLPRGARARDDHRRPTQRGGKHRHVDPRETLARRVALQRRAFGCVLSHTGPHTTPFAW